MSDFTPEESVELQVQANEDICQVESTGDDSSVDSSSQECKLSSQNESEDVTHCNFTDIAVKSASREHKFENGSKVFGIVCGSTNSKSISIKVKGLTSCSKGDCQNYKMQNVLTSDLIKPDGHTNSPDQLFSLSYPYNLKRELVYDPISGLKVDINTCRNGAELGLMIFPDAKYELSVQIDYNKKLISTTQTEVVKKNNQYDTDAADSSLNRKSDNLKGYSAKKKEDVTITGSITRTKNGSESVSGKIAYKFGSGLSIKATDKDKNRDISLSLSKLKKPINPVTNLLNAYNRFKRTFNGVFFKKQTSLDWGFGFSIKLSGQKYFEEEPNSSGIYDVLKAGLEKLELGLNFKYNFADKALLAIPFAGAALAAVNKGLQAINDSGLYLDVYASGKMAFSFTYERKESLCSAAVIEPKITPSFENAKIEFGLKAGAKADVEFWYFKIEGNYNALDANTNFEMKNLKSAKKLQIVYGGLNIIAFGHSVVGGGSNESGSPDDDFNPNPTKKNNKDDSFLRKLVNGDEIFTYKYT